MVNGDGGLPFTFIVFIYLDMFCIHICHMCKLKIYIITVVCSYLHHSFVACFNRKDTSICLSLCLPFCLFVGFAVYLFVSLSCVVCWYVCMLVSVCWGVCFVCLFVIVDVCGKWGMVADVWGYTLGTNSTNMDLIHDGRASLLHPRDIIHGN